MIKLYGNRQSRAARCLWLLEELGVPFEQVPIDIAAGQNREEAYLALNPAGKVPTLVDGNFVLSESIAINVYLAGRQPTALWPEPAQVRALILQWSSWATTEMETPFTAIVREKRAATAAGRDADGEVIAQQCQLAKTTLGRLETALGDDRRFLVGADFSLADINAATAVMLAPLFLDMADFPQSAAWLGRGFTRPAWQRVQTRA